MVSTVGRVSFFGLNPYCFRPSYLKRYGSIRGLVIEEYIDLVLKEAWFILVGHGTFL